MASRIKFQQNLDDLKEKLLIMAGMAEQAIQRSIEAYRTRDLSICELVFQSEPLINRLEREIDQMALDLLAMEQPMAIDLRFILAVIKINGDLERIGDQSLGIARRTRDIMRTENVELPVDYSAMRECAGRMIRTAILSLLEGDARIADSVREMDDEIDRMNRTAQADLLKLIQDKPQYTQQAMNGMMVSRSLERIADHAANIATDVIFWVRGADVRHQLSMSMD
jgi:phosphate transport system protein